MNTALIDQYRQLHERKPDYGSDATHAGRIAEIIETNGIQSVLDFGCGKGALVRELSERFPFVQVDGYDPAIPGKQRIPLERYDMVIANDVLEHLDPDDHQADLAAIAGLHPRWLFFNISCRPAVNVLPDGTNCHTLVRPPEWWRETLLQCYPKHREHASQWNERSKAWSVAITNDLDLTGKRVAIVGNAPQALANTEDIDGFDFVVRFNNFTLGPGFEAIGNRTDAIALAGGNDSVLTPLLQRFTGSTQHVIDLESGGDHLAQRNYPEIQRLLPHAEIVNARWVAEGLRRELPRGLPSTGISAIAWAMTTGASEIYLTGFSFEGEAFGHYFDPGHAMSSCHHFGAELRWLAARKDHPGLRFDDHIRLRIEHCKGPEGF